MGINGLLPFVQPSTLRRNIKDFKGFVAAIDVSCWLSQIGATNHDPDYIIRCTLSKLKMMTEAGVIPFLVFDGLVPACKDVTIEKRNRDSTAANPTIIRQQKREASRSIATYLRQNGISYVFAPYEADSQIALLMKQGIAQIVVTIDSDLIIYDCDLVLYKMDYEGNGDLYSRVNFLMQLGIEDKTNPMQYFRWIAIVAGCDYFKAPGIGCGTAWKLLTDGYTDDIEVFKLRLKKRLNGLVPDWSSYFADFDKANESFLYQLTFDINTKKMVPLHEYPFGKDHNSFPFAGEMFTDDEYALAFAAGNVSFVSKKIDNKLSSCPPPPFANLPEDKDVFFVNFEQIRSRSAEALNTIKIRTTDRFKCFQCDQNFDFVSKLEQHFRDSSLHPEQTEPFPKLVCSFCSQVYASAYHLLPHQWFRCNKRPGFKKPEFRCDNCKKAFADKYYLSKHVRQACPILHPKLNQSNFYCLYCNETFNNKLQQIIHQSNCNEDQESKETKDSEEKVESPESLINEPAYEKIPMESTRSYYKCAHCTFTSNKKSHFEIHKELHNDQRKKTFKCEVCEKRFFRKSDMHRHLRGVHKQDPDKKAESAIPAKEGAFKCPICPKTFAHASTKRTHVKTAHSTNPNRFKCSKCKKTYTTRGALNVHRAKGHKNKKWKCKECGMVSKSERLLELHHDKFCTGKKSNKVDLKKKPLRRVLRSLQKQEDIEYWRVQESLDEETEMKKAKAED